MRTFIVLSTLAVVCLASAAYADESKISKMQTVENPVNEARSSAVLLNAYKREFAFLEAEREALRRQIAELDQRMSVKVQKARSTVLAIQKKVAEQDLSVAGLQRTLEELESVQSTQESPDDLFAGLRSRGSSAMVQVGLPKFSADKFAEGTAPQNIDKLFQIVNDVLSNGQRAHTVPGRFFDEAGTSLQGEVLKLGYVASYGRSGDTAGMLRPAGDGRLQLVGTPEGAQAARAMFNANPPSLVPVFLYENLEKAVEMPKEKTVEGIIEAGGVIAYIIAVLGVIAILLVILRAFYLAYFGAIARAVVRWADDFGARKDHATLNDLDGFRGPHARVLAAVIAARHQSRDQQTDVFNQSFLQEQPKLDRFSAVILVLAAIAPLMGLLGTVTGMIATFDTITQFGTGNPKLLSGGISEALITTELGLIVAIPAVLFGNLLKGWSEQMKDTIERISLTVMNRGHIEGLPLRNADAERLQPIVTQTQIAS